MHLTPHAACKRRHLNSGRRTSRTFRSKTMFTKILILISTDDDVAFTALEVVFTESVFEFFCLCVYTCIHATTFNGQLFQCGNNTSVLLRGDQVFLLTSLNAEKTLKHAAVAPGSCHTAVCCCLVSHLLIPGTVGIILVCKCVRFIATIIINRKVLLGFS